VLLPMKRPDGSSNGIELQPIRQITGNANFSATFITEARAPLSNVIGGVNDGWRVTMTTLGNERGGNATTQYVQYEQQFRRVVADVKRLGAAHDPLVRQRLAWAYTHVEIMRYAGLRTLSEVIARKEPGPGASINKMFWSEYARDLGAWVMNLQGPHAMVRPNGEGYALDHWQRDFLGSRSGTIWGGTAQVQRNIVGERVLGLPKEPETEQERAR
jgi:alkylation response protein AidB-like acyl-CoA dehydrogenase